MGSAIPPAFRCLYHVAFTTRQIYVAVFEHYVIGDMRG